MKLSPFWPGGQNLPRIMTQSLTIAAWMAEYRSWIARIIAQTPGLTATQMARDIGLSPSTITRQMDPGWMRQPRVETLRRISQTYRTAIPQALMGGLDTRGFAEPDMLLIPPENSSTADFDANLSDWKINTTKLAAMGYLPGDTIRFNATIRPVAGDIVIAQVYRPKAPGAETVMRLFMPPYLLAAEIGQPSEKPIVIDPDGEHVVIMGTMVQSWRARATTPQITPPPAGDLAGDFSKKSAA
jgi:hypothetical protein